MTDLELRGVSKRFGRTIAIADLDLTVERGEFAALLGPSGCGKTTTLRAIAGFERPDAGEVWIKGRPVTALPPYRRDIGIVFQHYALFPHMTVFENIAYGLRRRRVPKPEVVRQVAQVLEMVQLVSLGDRYPRQLSGGQQQRVAVARAIVIQPSLLLFDEPLSNLDAKLRQEMRGELRRLQRRLEIATIFVTHDQDEALSMADRVIVMNHGRVEQIGTPEVIYSRPRTAFVATFIGECNFLSGRVVAVEAGVVQLAAGGLRLRVLANEETPARDSAGTIALRPEDVRLLPAEAETPGDLNVADGRAGEVTYLGALRRYRLEILGGPELLVYQQGRASQPAREGEAVRAAWKVSAGSFYSGEGPT